MACPSALPCAAAGAYGAGLNEDLPVLTTGSGTDWLGVTVPLPAGASPGIQWQGASCATAFSCVAAGSYGYPSDTQGLLLSQIY